MGNCMAACPLVSPCFPLCRYCFKTIPLVSGYKTFSYLVKPSQLHAMAVPMVSLASMIAAALSKSTIKTVDEFARAVESAPGFVANLLRNEGIREQAQHLHTEMGTVTDTTTTHSEGMQAAVAADDMVDIATAEAMVSEPLCMVAQAEAVAAALVNVAEVAERRASQLECALCDAQAQFDQAWQHNDCEKAAREAAGLRAEDCSGSRCGKQ